MIDPSANQRIYNRSLTHGVYLQWYKQSVVQDIVSYLDEEVWPDIAGRIEWELKQLSASQTRRLFEFQSATAGLISAGLSEAERRTRLELESLSVTESEWQVLVMRQSVPIRFDFVTPSPQVLKAVVSEKPFEGALLKDWFGSLSRSTQLALTNSVRLGVTEGLNPVEIARNLRGSRALGYADGVLQGTRRHVESVVRTAISSTLSAARDETFELNLEVIKGVQWVSVLDARTSLICQSRDGMILPVKGGPRPPAHWNCRSMVIPIIKSWRELGMNFNEMPEGTRASLNGQVAERVSYGEWLKSQSESIQNEALGTRRATLFRTGRVRIDRFVDRTGRTLRLSELRELEGLSSR